MRKIYSSNDVYDFVKPFELDKEKTERFICLYLKEDDSVIGMNDQTECDAMISMCRIMGVHKVIFITNHPNGSSFPTSEDFNHTYQLKCLLKAVNVVIKDHIIVGHKEFFPTLMRM